MLLFCTVSLCGLIAVFAFRRQKTDAGGPVLYFGCCWQTTASKPKKTKKKQTQALKKETNIKDSCSEREKHRVATKSQEANEAPDFMAESSCTTMR